MSRLRSANSHLYAYVLILGANKRSSEAIG